MYAQKLKQETIDGLRLHIGAQRSGKSSAAQAIALIRKALFDDDLRTLRTSIDKLEAKLGEFEPVNLKR